MQTIRVQNLVPEVYTDESRDFQLFCRLYDSLFNGIKFDTDTIKYIVDTRNIQASMLPLLQTKLGFFTKNQLDDTQVRYILQVFPDLLRNKGSLSAIKKLLNMCLKLNNISGSYTINYSDQASIINGVSIDSHTIIVGIDTIIQSTEILNELARYILPAGFSFYVFFFKNLNELQNIYMNDDVKLLYSSSNLNAQIRGTRDYTTQDNYVDYTMPISDESLSFDLLGGVDIAWINSIDSEISDIFKGIYESENDLPSSNLSTGDLAIAMDTISDVVYPFVYYYNSGWHKLNFVGNCELSGANPQVSNPHEYDIVCVPYHTAYMIHNGTSWVEHPYKGLFRTTQIADASAIIEDGDLISLESGIVDYTYKNNSSWTDVTYKATYSNENQISSDYNQLNNLVVLTGAKYWIYLNSAWQPYTDTIYMLKKILIDNESEE